jgi:GNAT superfamily N-acetyltransferase
MKVVMEDVLQIREMLANDRQEALRLSAQAGWNQMESDWSMIGILSDDSCFVGKIDGQIVATGTLVPYDNKCGWIGMLLVDEQHRRRGFGGAMLNRLVRMADEMGLEWVGLDATDMGEPLYRKRGFRTAGGVDRWKLIKPHWPLDSTRVRPFDRRSDDDAVRKLDLAATGMNRWQLLLLVAAACKDAPQRFVVCEKDGILGFGCSRPGRIGPYIGPVVAASPEIAAEIVSALLAQFAPSRDVPVFIDVPSGSAIEPWLIGEGFEVTRRLTRMVRGPAQLGHPQLLFAIRGFEWG